MKKIISLLFLLLFYTSSVFAAQSFVVKKIEVQGLQRITLGTALNYLPVKTGQRFSDEDAPNVIKALYKTGFFNDVSVLRQGNTLIIRVTERPTIGNIKITGNKDISTSDLMKGLNNAGIAVGNVYNRSVLDNMKNSLQQLYLSQGKYNAKIDVNAIPEPRNRVSIQINILEGAVAKIKEIKIIGNHTFDQKELLKQFKLSTPTFWSFITDNDQYSKQKLDGDLETLRSYYMDRGFIRFKILSTQVALTPDKKHVFITIRVDEGGKYTFSGYKLTGNLVLPKEKLDKLVRFKAGDTFSRRAVIATDTAIGKALGNIGYIYANVSPIPEVNDKTRQVFITFNIQPEHVFYVNRISFSGNTRTEDEVLRRAMRQMEGAVASSKKISESSRQLRLLGYLTDVGVKVNRVPGSNDKVNLNYSVKETSSAVASIAFGYGTDGFLINASLNQPNFLGTGKTVGLNVTKDSLTRLFGFNYYNPYYTKDGIGRGFKLYDQKTTPGDLNIAEFTTNGFGGTMYYNYPIGPNSSLSLGTSISHTTIKLGSKPSIQLQSFVCEEEGLGPSCTKSSTAFNELAIVGGWSKNELNKAIFPTTGLDQSTTFHISLPTGNKGELEYYKLEYIANWYHPISKKWVFLAHGDLGYGNGYGKTGGLPFFKNYYAGGTGTVRGFETNTLGPKDSKKEPLGGNVLAAGTISLILPAFEQSMRTSVFVDAGNVFKHSITLKGKKGLRYSAGIALQWRSPIGPLVFSIAEPLNAQSGDKKQVFAFTIGTQFS